MPETGDGGGEVEGGGRAGADGDGLKAERDPVEPPSCFEVIEVERWSMLPPDPAACASAACCAPLATWMSFWRLAWVVVLAEAEGEGEGRPSLAAPDEEGS